MLYILNHFSAGGGGGSISALASNLKLLLKLNIYLYVTALWSTTEEARLTWSYMVEYCHRLRGREKQDSSVWEGGGTQPPLPSLTSRLCCSDTAPPFSSPHGHNHQSLLFCIFHLIFLLLCRMSTECRKEGSVGRKEGRKRAALSSSGNVCFREFGVCSRVCPLPRPSTPPRWPGSTPSARQSWCTLASLVHFSILEQERRKDNNWRNRTFPPHIGAVFLSVLRSSFQAFWLGRPTSESCGVQVPKQLVSD